MSHAITCHLTTATVMLIISLFGVRMAFPDRDFSTPEIGLISIAVLSVSLAITGALHV
jgi:cytochrome b subunit of formate dehydrogenase